MTELTKIKIIARSKKQGAATGGSVITSSGVKSARTENADHALTADEATHAIAADTAAMADKSKYASQAGRANLAADLEDESPAFGKFLRKDMDDASSVNYQFGGNVAFSGIVNILNKILFTGGFSINADGEAVLKNLITSAAMSPDYSETSESGFALRQRGDGKYKMSLTDLEVWGKAIFHELEIRKLSYVGGIYTRH